MNRFPCILVIAIFMLGFTAPTHAQSAEPKPTPAAGNTVNKDKAEAAAEAERILKVRRAQARSLLLSLASDARNFRDQMLRARTLARIADSLWDADNERGRELFRNAWDAAEIADKEGQQRLDEEIRQQKAKTGGGFAVNTPPNLRGEVLRLAARRDRTLGEEFLEKLKADKQQEAADADSKTRRDSVGRQSAMGQRLALADQLLSAGDTERAIQFADPALGAINMQTINFLSNLRDKNVNAADERYAAMLARAAGDPQSDANTVSLLSSFIFTPHFFVTFSRGGTSSSQMSNDLTPATVPVEMRAAFFQTAAQILLRPLPPPEQDTGTSGIEGRYLVIKRLLPLFERYAPGETVELMRGQLEALNTLVRDDVRQRDDDWMRKGIKPEQQSADREQSILDKIGHAKTSAERDSLYLELAFYLSGKGDMRAREFVDKIDESELRQKARSYIDPSLAMTAIDKKQIELALELVRIGELTHIQKMWILTQAAKLLAKTDHDRSITLLDDAVSEARRIDGSDPDRPRALFAVANALVAADRGRAWDATFDAVKAANSADGFTGEDGRLVASFQTKGSSSMRSGSAPDFDVAGLFDALASEDYEKSIELARGFRGEAPRAAAVIAIARSVLNPKKPQAKREQPVSKD